MSASRTVAGVKQCRICGQTQLEQFLDLGPQPLANALLSREQLTLPEPRFPLRVLWCSRCSLAQLGEVVDPTVLYRHYVYHSSGMPASRHFQAYARSLVQQFVRSQEDLVVEIGSNDGHFLAVVKESGCRILGVDPARNIAQIANGRGIPTLPEFFTAALARRMAAGHGRARVLVANNVVAHINDHHDLMSGIDAALTPDGVFVLEAPYLVDMFDHLAYDSIYHEHLSYLAIRPLQVLLSQHGFEIFHVELYLVQGNSIRVFAARRGTFPVQPSVDRCVQRELQLKLNQFEAYRQLAIRIQASAVKLQQSLRELKAAGKRLAAYGAPARGNTVLNYAGVGTDVLEYAHEDLPAKVGYFTPGMHLPIVDAAYSHAHLPDYFLLLAWNYREGILAKEREFTQRGGRFIIPVGDEIEIIP